MSTLDCLQAALAALQPEHLEIQDESHMHSRGLHTHYKAVIVSPLFEGLNAVKRHQRVYAILGELMGQLHALALHTYTPQEWALQGTAPVSPACRGGGRHGH
jgi:BolA protein